MKKTEIPDKKYEKPKITKLTKMEFPTKIIESTGKGQVCKQCSS